MMKQVKVNTQFLVNIIRFCAEHYWKRDEYFDVFIKTAKEFNIKDRALRRVNPKAWTPKLYFDSVSVSMENLEVVFNFVEDEGENIEFDIEEVTKSFPNLFETIVKNCIKEISSQDDFYRI